MAKSPQSEDGGGDVLTLGPGQDVYRAGETGEAVYVIEEGEVELLASPGGHPVRVATLGPGELFGEGSVLGGHPREDSARAVTRCRLLRIDGPTLGELLRQHPEIALHMMRRLSRRLAAAHAATAGASAGPAVSTAPRLVHDSGAEFPLSSDGEVTIGRSDRASKFTPQIDLAPLVPPDAPRAVSRRHAVIVKQGGAFSVRELPRVANGTWVNGRKLEAGVPTPLADGDEIAFGPVKTVFRG